MLTCLHWIFTCHVQYCTCEDGVQDDGCEKESCCQICSICAAWSGSLFI